MGIFGVDVSNHQASFDFRGWDFAILKASEGSGFKDIRFRQHLQNARAAGCIVAAYHYQRPDSYVWQADNIESMVPKDVPVIIDVEEGSGSFDITIALVRELRNRGYVVPMSYIPRWWWQRVGSPDLSGLPPLWASWYPDYVARPREQGILKVPASAWNSYGNLPVRMMQFTSTPHDMNWFPGTRDELYALLYGKPGGPGGGGSNEDDMPRWDERVRVTSPNNPEYFEEHEFGKLISDIYYKTSDTYKEIFELEDLLDDGTTVDGIEGGSRVSTVSDKVKSMQSRMAAIEGKVNLILSKLEGVGSGPVDIELVSDLAADKAVDKIVDDLND